MSNYLLHSGKGHDDNPPGRGSGRYPYGSGKRPYQNDDVTRIRYSPSEKTKKVIKIAGISYGTAWVASVAAMITHAIKTADKVRTFTGFNTASNIATAAKFVNNSKISSMKVPVSLLKDMGLLF